MSEEFKEITQKVLKEIGEQNKRLEHLEEKIEEIIINQVKEFLSNEDIIIEDNKSDSGNLALKGIENRIKELEEEKISKNEYDELIEKIKLLEEENQNLKQKFIEIEDQLNGIIESNATYEKAEENIQISKEDKASSDLSVKKDGKVVNIVINV